MPEAVCLDRDMAVKENLGLVHACANRFRGRGVDYDDLFQAGCIGLIKAVDGFDAGRGFAFSTYAVPVILGEIRRIFRDGGTIKVGRTLKEKARHALHVQESMTNQLGHEPTISQLAQRLEMDVAETAEVLAAGMPALSLTENEESGGGQFDIPVDPPDEALSDSIALDEVIARLPERDRRLIELRYYRGMTQTRTAEQLGMSQVQVSRREKTILLELRRSLTG